MTVSVTSFRDTHEREREAERNGNAKNEREIPKNEGEI